MDRQQGSTLGIDFITHLPVWVLVVLASIVVLTIGALIMFKRHKARQSEVSESAGASPD